MELYSGARGTHLPSDADILSSAPFERVREHFAAKAEEQREVRLAEASAAAERILLAWKNSG